MTVTSSTSVFEIYDSEVAWPNPNEDDLAAWEQLDCGSDGLCGSKDDGNYFYAYAGMFGFEEWNEFVDACDIATEDCSDLFETDDYDGWSVGVYIACDDIPALLPVEGDILALLFTEMEYSWESYFDDSEWDFYWNDHSEDAEPFSEDYPVATSVNISGWNGGEEFYTYGFGWWYAYYTDLND